MRGHTVKTPENLAIAQAMRAEGVTLKEIAAHFRIATTTVHTWLHDPTGDIARARKDSYAQPCVDCGAPTSGSEGRREEPRCQRCGNAKAGDERKVWTREAIVLAIQEWAAEYGEPPGVADWNTHMAECVFHDFARAQRFRQAEGRWPTVTTVFNEWGSWNAAIAAAGFKPRDPIGSVENHKRSRRARAAA